MNDFDAVITIERPRTKESGDGKRIQDEPLRYDASVPVNVCAVDKTGVTATKLLNKIRLEVENAVELLAQRPTFTLIVETGEMKNITAGGFDPLWLDRYTFKYRPLVS